MRVFLFFILFAINFSFPNSKAFAEPCDTYIQELCTNVIAKEDCTVLLAPNADPDDPKRNRELERIRNKNTPHRFDGLNRDITLIKLSLYLKKDLHCDQLNISITEEFLFSKGELKAPNIKGMDQCPIKMKTTNGYLSLSYDNRVTWKIEGLDDVIITPNFNYVHHYNKIKQDIINKKICEENHSNDKGGSKESKDSKGAAAQ